MRACITVPLILLFSLVVVTAMWVALWMVPVVMVAFWLIWWSVNRFILHRQAPPAHRHGYDTED